jgi:hypothetical protein
LLGHCKDLLTKNGLVFVSVGLTSRIMHTSGQWIEGDFACKTDQMSAQQVGAAESYGRRYGLQGLLGICAEDDDDGNSASQPSAPRKEVLKNIPTPPPKATAPKKEPLVVPDHSPIDEEQMDAEGIELCSLTAFSKEKTDKKNNTYRGVLLKHSDNTEKWWNLYNIETLPRLMSMKGKNVYAKLEMKGEYPLCHDLTEVTA